MPFTVLLVNPNRIRPPIGPLGLEYLADALEEAGVAWRVLDLCFESNPQAAVARELADLSPGLIAISLRNTDDCYFASQHSFVPEFAELVGWLRARSDAPIVVGGSGYSVAPEGLLTRLGADYGIIGDGEDSIVRLALAIREGEDPGGTAGLVWRENGQVHVAPPQWGKFGRRALRRIAIDNARYFRQGGQGGLETKRGCARRCIYCADPLSKGHGLRVRPPMAVVREMRTLLSQGVDCLHLCDSEFNIPLQHAEAVCRAIIEHGLGARVQWYTYASPTPFSLELALLMRHAGCVGINFGVDSGAPEMLSRLGREHTPDDLRRTAAACREAGMACMYDLLLGAPGETQGSVRQTLELMKAISPDCVGIALGVRIYPGTALASQIFDAEPRLRAGLHGVLEDNDDLALPVFFLDPALGEDIVGLVRELTAGDRRFFFSWPDETQLDYNYDGNPLLVRAIADGARGAYWDILRKIGAE